MTPARRDFAGRAALAAALAAAVARGAVEGEEKAATVLSAAATPLTIYWCP